MHRDPPAAAEMNAPGAADQRRNLREAAARPPRLDGGELGANFLRERVVAGHVAGILARERRAKRGRREPAY
jgi:hypothetical protein